jgi:ATP-dependent DNA helicase RecQ
VVSPLISLVKEQVNALVQQGISSAYINSSLTGGEYEKVTSAYAPWEEKTNN